MDSKLTNIKDRILLIAKSKNITLKDFCNELGMSYSSFKGKAKKTPINSNAIATLIEKFPEINIEWLILGEGNMFK